MLREKFRKLEKLLLSEIKSYYGKRLISVFVFGSVARETQTFDSDLDLLIIAKGLPKGRMKRIGEFESVEEKIEPLLESLCKEDGINTYISTIIKSPEEAERGSPLFFDMVEDARILMMECWNDGMLVKEIETKKGIRSKSKEDLLFLIGKKEYLEK